jgi:hypothetical protein
VGNEVMMDQLISFHKPNKKVRSVKKIDHLIPPTKYTLEDATTKDTLEDAVCLSKLLKRGMLRNSLVRKIVKIYINRE